MRDGALQQVLTALQAGFAGADLSPAARAAVDAVFARAALPAPAGKAMGEDLPVAMLLTQVLSLLLPRTDAIGDLARALQVIQGDLVWTTRKVVGPTASAGFADAHANCLLVGPKGMEHRDDLWIGISLMAPGTRYPDHDHAPEEVYLVLSPGDFWHGDTAWVTPGIGGTVHNVPGIRHTMRAADAPFLAIWVLPV